MHEAMLYEKLPNSRVQCHTCQWRCTIEPGKLGVCKMYHNKDGTLFNMNYALVSSVAVDPIEKKPLFHFFPGSLDTSLIPKLQSHIVKTSIWRLKETELTADQNKTILRRKTCQTII